MVVKTIFGDMELLDNDSVICDIMKNTNKMYEEDFINEISGYIKKSRYIVDVGAHIGCHTVSYASLNKEALIYSFEPQKKVFGVLEKNIKLNNLENRVKIFNKAVGHSPGFFSLKSLESQIVGEGFNTGGIGLGKGGENIEVIMLDQLNLPGVDFMKVDVEGAEGLVFRGAARTILRFKPIILFEQNSQRVDPNELGIPIPTPFEALTELGYNTFYHIGNANYITVPK